MSPIRNRSVAWGDDAVAMHGQLLSIKDQARITYRGAVADAVDPYARIAVLELRADALICLLGAHGHMDVFARLPLGVDRLRWYDLEEVRDRVIDCALPVAHAIRETTPDEVILAGPTAEAILLGVRAYGLERAIGCVSASTLGDLALDNGAVVLATIVELTCVPYVRIATQSPRTEYPVGYYAAT